MCDAEAACKFTKSYFPKRGLPKAGRLRTDRALAPARPVPEAQVEIEQDRPRLLRLTQSCRLWDFSSIGGVLAGGGAGLREVSNA
jgi:hypothetical protein